MIWKQNIKPRKFEAKFIPLQSKHCAECLASSSKGRAGLDKVTVLPAVCTRYGSEIFRHDMIHHDTLAGRHQQILRSKTCGKRKKTASFCRFIGHLRLTSCEMLRRSSSFHTFGPDMAEGLGGFGHCLMSFHVISSSSCQQLHRGGDAESLSRNGAWGVHPSPSSHLRVAKLSEILRIALVCYVGFWAHGQSWDFDGFWKAVSLFADVVISISW